MPRRPDARNLSIQLTPAQYAALEAEAARRKIDISALVREVLGQGVPGFQDAPDVIKRGRYPRTKE